MTAIDVLGLMEASGALKHGHFLFSSGRHGDIYLEKFDQLRNPVATVEVCAGFAERFRDEGIDVVVGPTTGGVILAFEAARQLGTMAAYAERAADALPHAAARIRGVVELYLRARYEPDADGAALAALAAEVAVFRVARA